MVVKLFKLASSNAGTITGVLEAIDSKITVVLNADITFAFEAKTPPSPVEKIFKLLGTFLLFAMFIFN